MQLGLHILQRRALRKVAERVSTSLDPSVGVLEFLRQLEMLYEKPEDGRPLSVDGLDILLRAAGDDAEAVLRLLRARIGEARRYFDPHRIPVVFVVDSEVSASAGGPILELDGREHRLSALGGSNLGRVGELDGWWWTPQVG